MRMRISREALGFSPTTIGRLLGIPSSTWHNYEAGIRRISVEQMFKLKTRTGLTFEWIYEGDIMSLPPEIRDKIQDRIAENSRQSSGE